MSEQGSIFVTRDGICERDSYHRMSNAKQTRRLPRASRETRINMLETLPGALFVVDDADTIMYANASAQTLTGAPPQECLGNPFWRCAAQLVSTALYQAVRTTKQTREPTEVEYRSPVTQNWLHVQLSPTTGGSPCSSTR
jgi:PAS domain S-box-containing protein